MNRARHNSIDPRTRLRVLALASLWPSRFAPSQGIFNFQRFSALAQLADMALVSPVPFPQLWRRPPGRPPQDPFPVRRPVFWYPPRLGRGLHGRLMLACSWPALRALARDSRPQVFLANWAYPDGWAGVRAAGRLGLPAVLQILGSDLNYLANDKARLPYIMQALSGAAHVTTVSAALREKAISLGVPPGKVTVLPNGVNSDLFHPRDKLLARGRLGLPGDGRLVLFVGNLTPEKGPEVIIRALSLLPPGVRLIMLGAGPLAGRLRDMAGRLGLAGRIHWPGPTPHAKVADYMAACDCLALPSLREGEPNAVLEALASGRPVAASRVGGVPALVRDGAQGWLADPGDHGSLVQALTKVLAQSWNPQDLAASVAQRTWRANASQLHGILSQVRGS